MKAEYEITLKIHVIHDVDGFDNLKSSRQMANDIGDMVCDEAVMSGGVAWYEVLESAVNVPKIHDTNEHENKSPNVLKNLYNKFLKTY